MQVTNRLLLKKSSLVSGLYFNNNQNVSCRKLVLKAAVRHIQKTVVLLNDQSRLNDQSHLDEKWFCNN